MAQNSSDDKFFLTYNQQMRKLRNDKHLVCTGSPHKRILVRAGYFNIVNGYKNPFISGADKRVITPIYLVHQSTSFML